MPSLASRSVLSPMSDVSANSEVGAKLGRMPTKKGAIHCPMRRARLMLRDAASLCRTRVAERRHAWHCVCVSRWHAFWLASGLMPLTMVDIIRY